MPFADPHDEHKSREQLLQELSELRTLVSSTNSLIKSGEHLRIALEAADFGAFNYYPQTGKLAGDKRMMRLWGLNPGETPDYERLLKRVHVSDQALVRQTVIKTLSPEGNGDFQVEFRVLGADDTIHWHWAKGRVYFEMGSDGKKVPVHMTGVERDITRRKLAEEALRQSEARYRMLHESLRDAFVQVSMDGRILEFNDLYSEMLGYSPDELRTMTYEQLTPERWHAFEADILREQIIPRGHSDVYQKEYRRKDGTIFPVELRTILIRDQAGRPNSMWAMIRDITERKRAQEDFRRLNETLNAQVAESKALAENRTRQLQELAIELIEAEECERRRIAGLLHEDLQQLLAGARFVLQSAIVSKEYSALQEVEHFLEESIGKARHLSHELSPAVLHQSSFKAALEWLCGQMREQSGLDVHLDGAWISQIESAPLRLFLFRAVQELLFNVVKHAGVKSARVIISEEKGRISITVSDGGKGFDPAILDHPPLKAGLGLMSLRERASYIGGDLRIESKLGKGSRCTITIATKGIASRGYPSATGEKELAVSEVPGPDIRVLFVDDHKVMRQGLIKLISVQPDIQVAGEAGTGREAVQLARQLKPDVIVMDVSMPDMNGIEATTQIKAEQPEVRVIGLSMLEDEQVARDMRLAGAEAFISKSASMAELLKVIYGNK